jgi:hypothetical protein
MNTRLPVSNLYPVHLLVIPMHICASQSLFSHSYVVNEWLNRHCNVQIDIGIRADELGTRVSIVRHIFFIEYWIILDFYSNIRNSNNIRIFISLNKLPFLAQKFKKIKKIKKKSKLGNNKISCFRVDFWFFYPRVRTYNAGLLFALLLLFPTGKLMSTWWVILNPSMWLTCAQGWSCFGLTSWVQ